ncbi:hypothetical protein TCAL_11143 [Tigriopus californicus]|uniref:EF-hand domain-containing protein n=1 Tax=Tigriopus californicus TaxID=6832 RepID=A0A553N8E9_TIGCA|nr:uncharacterized protein LOC131884511 [Tigriopus californicus]XP_059088306.1 uncharacterized protein LOC131884511 [Tigriopus californicus]TRY61726.1 hypothetical protein TCAL_11143 [Tigriopus californicus]|eukprot:TCALIF_11143-PA protein Name:"Protein of unknown function" AED:0.19 eAED:0.19 QI:0/-1/0/1/-1/1/1/0/621
MAAFVYGDITRELHAVWAAKVGSERNSLPESDIQSLFNELLLFPSQAQIFEMFQCARDCTQQVCKVSTSSCSSSNDSPKEEKMVFFAPPVNRKNSLTFGEFCVFATELRKYYCKHDKQNGGGLAMNPTTRALEKAKFKTQKSSSSSYDVFLGGSCNPTSWRQDFAIPYFKSYGITYYNPQQSNWVPEMIELEHQAKQTSQILFFVMNEKTRNVVSMIEVAYLSGGQRKVIVMINPYPNSSHLINGEKLLESEYLDLNAGLTTVHDLVERQGIPVFKDINIALSCISKVLKENRTIEDLGLKDQVQPVKLAHIQIGDKLVRLREVFDTLDTHRLGKITLNDLKMAFRVHAHRDLTPKDLRQIMAACDGVMSKRKSASFSNDQVMIGFDQFCCIVSEFKHKPSAVDPSGSCREKSGVSSKANHLLRKARSPFHKVAGWIENARSYRRERNEESSSGLLPSSSSSSCNLKRRGSQIRDVYLGGASRGTRWREQIAIPMLKKHGLTYFNPHSSASRLRRLIPIEASAMDNSRVLLFVILGNSRSVSAMCEAAYYIGKGTHVVLCIQKIKPDTLIDGEVLSKTALKDFNRGRSYLSDIANREAVPIFEEINEAVECALQKCKQMDH